MADYISKSALIKNLQDWKFQECPVGVCEEETETYKTICECIKAVEELPTVDEKDIIRKRMEIRFPTIEEMVKTVAEKALNEYEYEGKTITQWVEILKDYDDKKCTLERILTRLEDKLDKTDLQTHLYKLFVEGEQYAFDTAIEIVKEEGGIE